MTFEMLDGPPVEIVWCEDTAAAPKGERLLLCLDDRTIEVGKVATWKSMKGEKLIGWDLPGLDRFGQADRYLSFERVTHWAAVTLPVKEKGK